MAKNTECALCQKPNQQIRLVNKMREPSTQQCVYDWLLRNEPTIEGSAQVCLPCVKQIRINSQIQISTLIGDQNDESARNAALKTAIRFCTLTLSLPVLVR